jgi:hypothetical protein
LKIGVKLALRFVVSVRNLVARLWPLSCNLTNPCHKNSFFSPFQKGIANIGKTTPIKQVAS